MKEVFSFELPKFEFSAAPRKWRILDFEEEQKKNEDENKVNEEERDDRMNDEDKNDFMIEES